MQAQDDRLGANDLDDMPRAIGLAPRAPLARPIASSNNMIIGGAAAAGSQQSNHVQQHALLHMSSEMAASQRYTGRSRARQRQPELDSIAAGQINQIVGPQPSEGIRNSFRDLQNDN